MKAAVLVALLVTSSARAEKLEFDPASIYKVPQGSGPTEGPASAPITIVVWSDHACGYCVRSQVTLDLLVRLYPGQIRFVHRTLPLDEDNTLAAEAALAAAAQHRFRPMNERLYAVHGKVDRPAVELMARELGLDMLRFRAALDTGLYRAQIAADVKDATALGVTGTPVFFVNGRAISGNQPLRAFAETVDQELARAAQMKRATYDALVASGKLAADIPDVERSSPELDPATTYKMGLGLPGHQQGPDSALVTIVVWGDFQCRFCQKMAPVLAQVRARYGDDVRVVYRHLPMSFHKKAALAAEAAVAAAEQGKFWAFHDAVWAGFGNVDRADLEQFAMMAGLDLPKFRAALDERRYHDVVIAEGAAALALGIDGTPTTFVNGKPIVGARDLAGVSRIVAEQLDQARRVVAGGIESKDYYAVVMSGAIGLDRADPASIPDLAGMKVALRADDKSRAVAAACRRRDARRATELSAGLTGDAKRRAMLVCAAGGIDLP
ncbi:MAG TPA: thioredoxin domain-containing protein [Kofleriaceae bacterium]|nr:thioredoxin domain-containing protein [Kofleriaceae bacterium]